MRVGYRLFGVEVLDVISVYKSDEIVAVLGTRPFHQFGRTENDFLRRRFKNIENKKNVHYR